VISNYLICSTPRSGSNYLCELLSSLGFAGSPEEHLWDPPDGTPLEPLSDRWPRVLEAGTGSNGVFGLKVMFYQAERLERDLPAVLGKPGRALADVLAEILCDSKYIYLTRRDHLRQAVSLVRAMQTKQWRSLDQAVRREEYDRAAIDEAMESLVGEERLWENFFTRQHLRPYRLTYEDFERDPGTAVAGILRHLGHGPIETVSLPPSRHRRQADDVTEDWVRCYRAGSA